eukprot:233469-Chlamydomonas_euryale.AAC.2
MPVVMAAGRGTKRQPCRTVNKRASTPSQTLQPLAICPRQPAHLAAAAPARSLGPGRRARRRVGGHARRRHGALRLVGPGDQPLHAFGQHLGAWHAVGQRLAGARLVRLARTPLRALRGVAAVIAVGVALGGA